jgi:phosphoglycolate phosphatase-like HAD superfamily hydrolase
MGRFDLVIFDCDGVLVDSERLASEPQTAEPRVARFGGVVRRAV